MARETHVGALPAPCRGCALFGHGPGARSLRTMAVCLVLIACAAQESAAQPAPGWAVEGSAGWALFVDAPIHWLAGAGGRFYLTPRLAVGPEVVYMKGPGTDRDLMLTGNLTFDVLRSGAPGRIVNPYVVVGGGLFQHRDEFASRTFTASDPAFTAGGGVRFALTHRLYVAPEARLGGELHVRSGISVGYRF